MAVAVDIPALLQRVGDQRLLAGKSLGVLFQHALRIFQRDLFIIVKNTLSDRQCRENRLKFTAVFLRIGLCGGIRGAADRAGEKRVALSYIRERIFAVVYLTQWILNCDLFQIMTSVTGTLINLPDVSA